VLKGRTAAMKILIVEDEPKTVAYLRKGLTEQGYAVDFASDGENGLHLAQTLDYDAVILDVMLPRLDGIALLERLRQRRQTPVIMLTARDSVEARLQGLGAGADDYLVKPFSFLELLARLQAITRRGRNESTSITVGDLHLDLLARRATRAGRRLNLTAKEFALLAVLGRRQSQIVSKTVITELVWDINFDTNTNVVEVAIKRLRAKIDGGFEGKLLHTIRGMGYVLEHRPEEIS
jgi:two-component system copper resistance phosphate regulon response regulator CusR